MTTQIETVYESAKETAKKIRVALKENFPGVKFSVTSKVYTGGDNVNVSWIDLPMKEEVEKVVNQFKSGSFNGMEDIYETSGYVMDGKKYVGAKYIFCTRELSEERKQEIKEWMKENYYDVNENSYEYFNLFNKAEKQMMTEEATKVEVVEVSPVIENKITEQNEVSFQTGTGSKGNGIEISFTSKPSENIRTMMKENGFRWAGKQRSNIWWAINTEKTLNIAEAIVSAYNDTLTEESNHEEEIISEKIETIHNKLMNQETKPYSPNKGTVERIEKAVNSLEKKLDSLSGDYLTNTWKRMKEEESRQIQREKLRKEIDLLNYLHSKIQSESLTIFEESLITGSFRDTIDSYYRSHYEYKHEIKFPVIDYKYDLNGWYNKEVPTKQNRLRKSGINNTIQLLAAIEQYKQLLQAIDKPIDLTQHKIKKLESEVKFKNIPDYFPTPKTITDQLIELAEIEDNMSILEPSAGNGNIMDSITNYTKENNLNIHLKGMEINFGLVDILKLKQYEIKQGNFLELNHLNRYHRIIMNPPFSNLQDIDHVLHAYQCLQNGGKLVAIMSEGAFFRTDKKCIKFREFLSNHGYSMELDAGTFKESGTMVKSRIVVIDKPETLSQVI